MNSPYEINPLLQLDLLLVLDFFETNRQKNIPLY